MNAISPQLLEFNRKMKDNHALEFDILSDRGNEVARTFGLEHQIPEELRDLYIELDSDLSKFNGDDDWKLPLPARYIIDPDGMIQYARVNADYKDRPEPRETLEVLRKRAQ